MHRTADLFSEEAENRIGMWLMNHELWSIRAPSGDFRWDITHLEGFPAIDFDVESIDRKVKFRFSFSGALGPEK